MANDADDLAARVARGAALLDRVRPDWIRMQPAHIAFERLDGGMMVLVWGSLPKGLLALVNAAGKEATPWDYGMVGRYDDLAEFELMNIAWRAELAKEKGETVTYRTCEICGKEFLRVTRAVVCSEACKAEKTRRYYRNYNKTNYSDPKDPPREKRKDGSDPHL